MRARVLILAIAIAAVGCGGDDDEGGAVDSGAGAEADAGADAAAGADANPTEDLDMTASDFGCIRDGTKVHKFYLWNPLGHLDDAVAVANSPTGGTYPVGTIVQLIPAEAMVKRRPGWSPSTNDWEFFALTVAGTQTTIDQRGKEDVMNSFGGNCFECHSEAEKQWDLICEEERGCAPLGITDSFIEGLQNSDTRCL